MPRSEMRTSAVVTLVVGLLWGGCWADFPDGRMSSEGSGAGDQGTDCIGPGCGASNDGQQGSKDGSSAMVDGCGGEFFNADSVPPNVMIVLDRSGSMRQKVSGTSKWDIALQAVQKLLSGFGDKVRFGLLLYPGTDEACDKGGTCDAGKVFVDVGGNTAGQINAILASADTCSIFNPMFRTPIAATLNTLANHKELQDSARENYVLLLTDGDENCQGDPVAATTALSGAGIKTFVVGFGGGVDSSELSAMAQAGGTAKSGKTAYYQADDAASLDSAFGTIGGSVLSCVYNLSDIPEDPNRLYVYFDKVELPRDTGHADGWDYDATQNQITFFGQACAQLKAGQVKELVIVFGCKLTIE